jgi:hypothetical protein
VKKSIYVISIIAIGLVFFGEQLTGFTKLGLASLMSADVFQKETQEEIKEIKEIKGEVVLEINYGDGNNYVSPAEFVEGMSALSLLEDKITELKSKLVTTTNSSTGAFIKAIGDKENGKDDKYWLYYVNGEMPQVSADKKELSPGDKVEFKFEKSPF